MAQSARTIRSRSRAFAACLTMAAMGVTASARADSTRFSWVRSSGADPCPSRDAALIELEALLHRSLDLALDGRSLEVVLSRRDDQWNAELFWRASHGGLLASQTLRSAEPSCAVFASATLTSAMVALVTGVHPESAPEPARPAVAPRVEPQPSPPAVTPSVTQNPAPTRAGWTRGDIALGLVFAAHVMPALNGGVQLYAEPFVYERWRLGASVTVLAESMLGLSVVAGFSVAEFGGHGCARVTPGHWRFSVSPCAGLRAGAVAGFGYDAAVPTGGTHGSFAVNGSLLLRAQLGPVVLSLDPAFRWNVSRYTLRSTAGQTLAEQSVVGFTLDFRIGLPIS